MLELNIYSVAAFFAAGISIVAVQQAVDNNESHVSTEFSVMMGSLFLWALLTGIQLALTTYTEQWVWHHMNALFTGIVPAAWLAFTLAYSKNDEYLTTPIKAVLIGEPVVFSGLVFTNQLHGLVWTDLSLNQYSQLFYIDGSLGAIMYVHLTYAYAIVLLGILVLIRVYMKSPQLYRRETTALVLGALIPLSTNIANTLNIHPGPVAPIDLTPFTFAVSGILFSMALFELDLVDRASTAPEQALNVTSNEFLVLDPTGRIVSTTGGVTKVFESDVTDGAVFHEVTDLVDDESIEPALQELDTRIVSGNGGQQNTFYEIQYMSQTDYRGDTAGYIVTLEEVSDRIAYARRLEVAQRVLRHNLRNDMTVIRGWAEQVKAQSEDGTADAANEIITTANDLIRISEKTKEMIEIESLQADTVEAINISKRTNEVISKMRTEFPAAIINQEITSGVSADFVDNNVVELPLENVIENAIEHNPDESPWVRVELSETQDEVVIEVADNGPGIPDLEIETLRKGAEDKLQHGSSIGLWLTYWKVKEAGGDINFEDRDPTGSIVTLRFPKTSTESGTETPVQDSNAASEVEQ